MTFQHILADLKWLREDRKPNEEVLSAISIVQAFVEAEDAKPPEPTPQPFRGFYKVVRGDSDCAANES